MLRKISIISLFVILANSIFAQDATTLVQSGVDLNVIYRNEATFGVLAHSNGFGITYRRAKHMTADRKRVIEFEFVNMSHPKEVKTVNPYYENSKGFYYGELNSMLIPRIGLGYQNVLYRKAERRSVEIRYSYYLGLSLGLLKPVYLEILPKNPTSGNEVNVSTERYDPNVHTMDRIYGAAPYFKGIDELSVYPGGYLKLGLSFEYGNTRSSVKAVETGVTFDAYPKVVPLMAYAKNYQVFPSFYISLIFGRKWF